MGEVVRCSVRECQGIRLMFIEGQDIDPQNLVQYKLSNYRGPTKSVLVVRCSGFVYYYTFTTTANQIMLKIVLC